MAECNYASVVYKVLTELFGEERARKVLLMVDAQKRELYAERASTLLASDVNRPRKPGEFSVATYPKVRDS
jgi:hypothetical protein